METVEKKSNRTKNGITKEINTTILHWTEHITTIDISNANLKDIDEATKFPPNLSNLNLAHNSLVDVPGVVLKLTKLKHLDVSYNSIIYFDETPNFCHSIETLNISHNHLAGPPYWIWAFSPQNLTELNLNYNFKLAESLNTIFLTELTNYRINATIVKIAHCNLHQHLELLNTFSDVKSLEVGASLSNFCNRLLEIPCIGLDKCSDIERLNLTNTQIYNIKPNIDMFKHLIEIDLSLNNICDLPAEFCNLISLEICILSSNNLLYLPENIYNLKKLRHLHIDNNELCMLPDRIVELVHLELVDLYNNCLYGVPDEIRNVEKLDLAQNYFNEPDDEEYLRKKTSFRTNVTDRYDGRREEPVRPESVRSCDFEDEDEDEEYLTSMEEANCKSPREYNSPSSPEDWDSDDYWVPCSDPSNTSSKPISPWIDYVKQKMAEGNFCPMDAHTVPIVEVVKYENQCSPKVWVEVNGQFDDHSDDDS